MVSRVDLDPRTNVVVFQLNNSTDGIAIGRAPTVAEDGVRQAWEGVRREDQAAPESVVALHCEWEPTPTDMAFIEVTFPGAPVTFNFDRPTPGGWEEALTAAQATMAAAAAHPADDGDDGGDGSGSGGDSDGGGDDGGSDGAAGGLPTQPAGEHRAARDGEHTRLDAGRHVPGDGGTLSARPGVQPGAEGAISSQGELLPVLWSASSPRVGLLEAVPHWPVAAGRLHLALAVVALTPRGTIGMYHVTHHQLGGQSFDELMAEACENLADGLRVDVRETDDGQLLSLAGTLVAAMVCLPDFYRRLSQLANSDRLVVGLPCPDEVYVTAADSPLAELVHGVVRESEYPATELVPSVLSIVGDDIEVLFERG